MYILIIINNFKNTIIYFFFNLMILKQYFKFFLAHFYEETKINLKIVYFLKFYFLFNYKSLKILSFLLKIV